MPVTSSDWAAWVGALATLSAVLVALFQKELVGLWRKPVLTSTVKLAAPHCHLTYFTELPANPPRPPRPVYMLRLWIENIGNAPAERVQVFAWKVERKDASGTFGTYSFFMPMNLKWSHSTGPEAVFATMISHGMGRHCDFAFVVHPGLSRERGLAPQRKVGSGTWLHLTVEFPANIEGHILEPGEYRVHLRLAGANVSPADVVVNLRLTGEWFENEDDMFSKGIGFKMA